MSGFDLVEKSRVRYFPPAISPIASLPVHLVADTGGLPMWCPACRADVAAELSQDSRRFRCARCGVELGVAKGALGTALPTPALPTDAERNARELLARWNAQNQLTAPAVIRTTAPMDPPHVPKTSTTSEGVSQKSDVAPAAASQRRKKRRLDRSSAIDVSLLPGLHETPPAKKPTSLGSTVGQMCAYFGIGLITCGTSVVLWGFFGGPENFAPTGWLVTTIGQMFLFLGVVTLISSGMEQTSADMAHRLDALGQRLIRMELLQREQVIRGPHRRRKNANSPAASSESPAADAA